MPTCAACQTPLFVDIGASSEEEEEEEAHGIVNGASGPSAHTIPDDVHLRACGHHFHWSLPPLICPTGRLLTLHLGIAL